MSDHLIMIDGNSIAHANHNANVLTVGEMQVQAIFGMLKSLRVIARGAPKAEIIVLWDGKAEWRKQLFPEYKGNRVAMTIEEELKDAAFKKQTPILEKAIEFLGVKQVRSPLLEADDLAGFFTRVLAPKGRQITLVSGDRDWLSLVSENVSWFDPIRNRRVDASNFLDFTGFFTTDAFVQGKALQGDDSDNIPGIYKLGEKTAQLMLAKWKDIDRFFEAVDSGEYTPAARKDKNAKSLHPEQLLASPEGREIFRRNMKLMDLRQSRSPEQGEVIIKKAPPNPEAFTRLCERLAFMSILRERRQFLGDFGIDCTPYAAAA